MSDGPAEPTIEHHRLRSAIEFAVGVSDAGQRLRPPLEFPAALRPYLKLPRIPGRDLGKLRRALEADDAFRRRLAVGVVDDLVDPIGREWLRREDGWQERVSALIAAADEAEAAADAAAALRRSERRREAAERTAVRTRAEIVALTARVDELQGELAVARDQARSHGEATAAERAAAADARLQIRHAEDRAKAARGRLAMVEAERDAARRAQAAAEHQRDALLAERAERSGVALGPGHLGDLRQLARSARLVAERLDALVVTPPGRTPLALPGGVVGESSRATEFLLRSGAVVLVDGYNVAMHAWPECPLADQRERLLDAVDDLARRLGTELVVVFDGADVVGAHSLRRRLARVTFSPPGTIADDVIRAEVAALPPTRSVVVVTSDQAIRRDVVAAGANTISNAAFHDFIAAR